MANKGGFSWKTATGITKMKQNVSRKTGIPTTKSGRQRKVGKAVMGSGCLIPVLVCFLLLISAIFVFAHPGRTDSNGGHTVNTDGWGYEVGTYHYHDKKYENIIPVDKESGKPLGITVIVNGENVLFDQPPIIMYGRTLVPVRYVVEKLGCSVDWDGESQTVYVKNSAIENIPIDGYGIKVAVNNEPVSFDVSPTIINGRTLIPIRAVVEKLGCSVDWDPDLQVVYID